MFSWFFTRLQGLKEQHVHRDQRHGDRAGLEEGSQQIGP